MNKLWTIFKREYLTRVKTKGFIIGTILMPVFIILISIGPGLLMSMKSDDSKNIAVLDLSGIVFDELGKTVDDTTKVGQRKYNFSKVDADTDLADIKNDLSNKVDKNEINAYLIIPENIIETNETEYYAKSVTNFDENRMFRSAVSKIIIDHRLKQSNLNPEQINKLTQWINFRTFKVIKAGEEKEDIGLSFAITFIMIMFLYMALLIYGAFVMRSVYEEKISRVVEIIISSCKPFQLMAGKVLGIGALGLTQYLIWAAVAGLLTLYGGSIVMMFTSNMPDISLPTIPISVLIYFVTYFILGYLLYATMYAALGAMVNSDQDAQQLQMPVIMFIILAFILSMSIIKNPTSNMSLIISMIPFFAPITMFARITVQMPPVIEIMASIGLLILTIIFMIWFAGKIFRIGILMYGKRPTLPEVLKWIRY